MDSVHCFLPKDADAGFTCPPKKNSKHILAYSVPHPGDEESEVHLLEVQKIFFLES